MLQHFTIPDAEGGRSRSVGGQIIWLVRGQERLVIDNLSADDATSWGQRACTSFSPDWVIQALVDRNLEGL
jgi:hypothetical protein